MISRLGNGLPAKLSSGPRTGYDMAKTGTMLGRGENERELLPAAPWSQTWPAPSATLDLDFVNDRGFVRGVGQGRSMDAVTFSRASNATWVGPDGLLRTHTLGRNLLSYPQNFDIGWGTTTVGTSNLLQSKNQEDPLGGFTATAVNETNEFGQFFLSVDGVFSFSNTAIFTRSIYVKYNGARYISLGHASDGGPSISQCHVLFDLISKTVIQTEVGSAATLYSYNIQDVGNGWLRLSVTTSIQRISNTFYLAFHKTNSIQWGANEGYQRRYQVPGYVGDGSGIYVWGAQLEEGTVATEYFPTNINTPRFDWGSTAVIPVTNILTNSDTWITSSGLLGASFTLNATTSPQNTGNAIAFTELSTTGEHYHLVGIPDSNNNAIIRTFSYFAKANGRTKFQFFPNTADFSSGTYAEYDLVNITATAVGNCSATISDVGDGWRRVTITWQSRAYTYARLLNELNQGSYAGNGTSGIFIWGFALEYQNTATPYKTVGSQIPTTTPLLPTTSSNGLLIEEQRTNLVLWNRDLTKTYTPPINLFAQSENFTSAVGVWNWDSNQTQLQRITGSLDPLGGNTATLIRPNSGRTAANAYIGQRAGTSTPSTFSVYMSASGYNFGVLSSFAYTAGNFAVFNLASGSMFTTASTAGLSSSIESVGNGWYRCSLTVNNTTLNRGFLISASPDGTTTTTANGTGSIAIWGAQANNGLTASAYVSSSTLPTPLWIADNVTTAKDQVGIDGISNAASSVSASANNGTIIYRAITTSQPNACSVFLKRLSGTGNVQISLDGVTWSTVDISDVEWRRIVLTGTVTNPCIGIRLATAGDVIAMDYSQVEAGSWETSPILTTTATTTRNADSATMIAYPLVTYNNIIESGTMYAEWLSMVNSGGVVGIGGNARIYIQHNLNYQYWDGGSGYALSLAAKTASVNKMAVTFDKFSSFGVSNGINIVGNITIPVNYSIIPRNWVFGNRPDTEARAKKFIQRVMFFPKKLSIESLGTITL